MCIPFQTPGGPKQRRKTVPLTPISGRSGASSRKSLSYVQSTLTDSGGGSGVSMVIRRDATDSSMISDRAAAEEVPEDSLFQTASVKSRRTALNVSTTGFSNTFKLFFKLFYYLYKILK